LKANTESSATPPLSKKALIIAFFTIFLDLLGFGIIIPIQPFYAKSLGATATVVTLLGASYSIMQFLFSPFWGQLSDRFGRRPIILFSVFISAIGHFIFAFASGLGLLFLARSIAGFGNANLGTAQAIIADVTTKENRAKGMALIGVAFGLGFLFGPAIGGLLGQISPQAPFIAAGILSVLNFIFAYFMLPETKSEKSVPSSRRILPFSTFKEAQQYVNVRTLLILSIIYTTGFSLMEQAISLYIEHIWVTDTSLSSDQRIEEAGLMTAYFLIVVGITAIVVQGGLVGRLKNLLGEVRMIQIGISITMISMICIPLIGGLKIFGYFLGVAVLLAIGTGILNPAKSALLSLSVPSNEQGSILGLNQSFSALGRAIGPTFSGLFYEIFVGLPFYVAFALFGLGTLLTVSLKPPPDIEEASV
jgi:MFS transporter, DHA1 family, tetracycline resistance protein